MIKKENILESARKVLTEQGINKLSLRKIAAETGCAAPSIYYYFKNKQEIVAGLWEEVAPNLENRMQQASDKKQAYREFWLTRPDDFRLFITNAEYFPFVAATERYKALKGLLGTELHTLNGELMEKIYTQQEAQQPAA
ncbi:TetR/AcrR family transcriptional regulator [Reinekea marinisedimentorum]|uniref:Regulatory TetR family protein n=1 Tax=Reinekea marinisedimentorum TaxID=230495 RepID=A0A4R3I7C1_9GAMM|nr:TetR/AcrR family transcriptional regulator [Reinekea marinisedimentorum]TCS41670.1 regulatory TetR family protein [Reinekea marinisedimentorum]